MPVRVSLVIVIGVVAAVLFASSAAASAGRLGRLSAQAACPGAMSLQTASQRVAAVRCLVNWARVRYGRQPVRAFPALTRAARRKAADVIRCGAFTHRPCGRVASAGARAEGYPIRAWGENLYLADGGGATPLAAIRAWLSSPRHRAVLLYPGFVHVGVAVVPAARIGEGPASLTVLQLGAVG